MNNVDGVLLLFLEEAKHMIKPFTLALSLSLSLCLSLESLMCFEFTPFNILYQAMYYRYLHVIKKQMILLLID